MFHVCTRGLNPLTGPEMFFEKSLQARCRTLLGYLRWKVQKSYLVFFLQSFKLRESKVLGFPGMVRIQGWRDEKSTQLDELTNACSSWAVSCSTS